MRPSVRLLVVSTLVAAGLASGNGPAHAVKVPRTLAHSVRVGGRPVAPGFSIDFVGVQWKGGHKSGAIRFLKHGRWEPWRPLVEDGVHVPGRYATFLVSRGVEAQRLVRPPLCPRDIGDCRLSGPPDLLAHAEARRPPHRHAEQRS